MVPCDADFVCVRKVVEPGELSLQFGERAVDGEVAGVDEDVAVRDIGWRLCVSDTHTILMRGVLAGGNEMGDWWV